MLTSYYLSDYGARLLVVCISTAREGRQNPHEVMNLPPPLAGHSVLARSATPSNGQKRHTHRRICKNKTAKNLQRIVKNTPRTIQNNDGTDTPSYIHSPQLAKRITARLGPNAEAAVSTPHGIFTKSLEAVLEADDEEEDAEEDARARG